MLMVVIWGSTFIVIKQSLEFVDPVVMLVYRFGLAAAVTLGIVLIQKKNPFVKFKQGMIVGFLLWLIYISQNIGMQYTSASNSGFITALFVAFVPLVQILFFGQRPAAMRLLAALISLVGLWFLTGGFQNLNKGDAITLIGPVAFAFYMIINDRYLKTDADPLVIAFQQFFAVAALSLVFVLVTRRPWAMDLAKAGGAILYLALFGTVLTFTVYNYVQRISTPMKVALILVMEPVFAALFAHYFGGETFFGLQIFGGALIILAMLLSEIKFKGVEAS